MKLKGECVLLREEFEDYQRVFAEKDIHTFADWLHYYSQLDLALDLEALEKIKDFYTETGWAWV